MIIPALGPQAGSPLPQWALITLLKLLKFLERPILRKQVLGPDHYCQPFNLVKMPIVRENRESVLKG